MESNNERSVWETDANQGRDTELRCGEFDTEFCAPPGVPHPDYIGPVILAGTDGSDYSVLDKVDPRVKDLALHGQLNRDVDLIPMKEGVYNTNDGNILIVAPTPKNWQNQMKAPCINEASEDTLEEAYGPRVEALSPENKYWLMKQMGFKGLGHGKWKHILFDEEIEFDLNSDTLVQLTFRVLKAGYKNAHTEWASQQKTNSI